MTVSRHRIAGLALLLTLACAPAAASAHAADRRSVSVDGHGEVTAVPDMAELTMTVQADDTTVSPAQHKVDDVMRTLVKRLRALGVADKDFSTTGISVQPQYDYHANQSPKLTGYRVTRRANVTLRDLDKLGDLLQQATAAGVNGIGDPELASSKATALQRQALAAAAEDARANAAVLAKSLGASLGPVHSISVSGGAQPVPMVRMMAAAKAAPSGNESAGINAGEIRVTADVRADFDLVP